MDNNKKNIISIEDFLELYPKLSLRDEHSLPSDIFLEFFNIKNRLKRRKSQIITDNAQVTKKYDLKNMSHFSLMNINTTSFLSLKKLEKTKTSINDKLDNNKNNHYLKKIIENEDIDKSINLENEDLFLINKGIELQKKGLKRTNDIKKALQLFFNKSQLIEKITKSSDIYQEIDITDKNDGNNEKRSSLEINIHQKIKNLISKLAENVYFEKHEKNKFIIRMNEKGKDCYFLISGRLSILKPVEYKRIEITYDEYFKYLLSLLEKNEKGVLKKVLGLNRHFINISDEEDLINIAKYYIQSRISIYSNISYNIYEKDKFEDLSLEKIELFLSEYKMNFESFGLSMKKIITDLNEIINDPEIKDKNIQYKINDYFREIFRPSKKNEIMLSPYNFLFNNNHINIFDNNDINNNNFVTLIKYEIFMILEPGAFFGEMSLENESNRRNATIRTEEDCVLVSLNIELYHNLLLDDNKKLKILQVNFLCKHYFFNNITPEIFTKYYYSYFKLIFKKKDQIIYKQETPCTSLFLLKDGVIKYIINSSIIDIHELIKYFIKSLQENKYLKLEENYIKLLKQKYLINNNLLTYKNNSIILIEKIKEKYKFELSISSTYECLGIHEFFADIGHISTCYVTSKTAKLFEIRKDSLKKIISLEKGIVNDYYQLVLHKILAMINRLFNIENNCIKQIQDKINTNFFSDINYHSNLTLNHKVSISNEDNSNAKIEKNNSKLCNNNSTYKNEETILTKEFENFGHINDSIIKNNTSISQIKFQNEQKKVQSMRELKKNENNNTIRSSFRIIDYKRNRLNTIIKKIKENNNPQYSMEKNKSNNLYDLKGNNSIIFRKNNLRLKNSNSFIYDKKKFSPKTIINVGNSYLSLPKLKKKLLFNKKNNEHKTINLSIVKNNYNNTNELCQESKSIKKETSINNYHNKNISINTKENFLPTIKKSDSSGLLSFLNKKKTKTNLTKIKNNSESKTNHNKEININTIEKKENVLAKCIKNFYQKRKKKGYLGIINPLHNSMMKHKLLNNNLINKKK